MKNDQPLTPDVLAGAVARVASRWADPEYPPRAGAVEQALEAPNRFTEEAVAFAVNQQMSVLTKENLLAWLAGRRTAAPRTVGVLNAGNIPLVGLQDFLAVLLVGHRYLGTMSSKSPALLPALASEIAEEAGEPEAQFVSADRLFEEAEAVVATGTDETATWVRAQAAKAGIPPARCLVRGHRYSVAVIDGNESEDEREGLAEDVLLHEGFGCRNVALVWAPAGLSPDAYLDSFAAFRSVFPAHPATPGALKMQQAMLAAVDAPHAYGDGLEFLMSKGAPDVQQPGHVRWTEYDALEDVSAFLKQHADEIQLVVAREGLARRLDTDRGIVEPGMAQRPPLSWCPDGRDTIDFLVSI